MARLFKKISKTAGLVPGTLVHVGEEKTEQIKITIIVLKMLYIDEKVA